jgi:hypothetical protein
VEELFRQRKPLVHLKWLVMTTISKSM